MNNIEQEPDYYFPQLRIALCLECSKKFEILRNNRSVRESFIESIEETTVSPSDGTVEISIGDQETIKFTGKHFAEIQEILRQKPKK